MSLQHAAQHLAAHGRGPDTVLVHMSKGEVKSLNDLAMAHGGHLTINPKTGLPEAGFLSSILPMALGFALGPTVCTGSSVGSRSPDTPHPADAEPAAAAADPSGLAFEQALIAG